MTVSLRIPKLIAQIAAASLILAGCGSDSADLETVEREVDALVQDVVEFLDLDPTDLTILEDQSPLGPCGRQPNRGIELPDQGLVAGRATIHSVAEFWAEQYKDDGRRLEVRDRSSEPGAAAFLELGDYRLSLTYIKELPAERFQIGASGPCIPE